MTASRLRDLVSSRLEQHKDVQEVAFSRSTFADRLGLNVRDTDGMTWRVWVSRDPWEEPNGGAQ